MSRPLAAAVAATVPRALGAAALLCAAAPLHAQTLPDPAAPSTSWRVELGAAVSRPLLDGAFGARVLAGVAPSLGVTRAWHRPDALSFTLGVRGSRAALRVDEGDAGPSDYDAGTLWQGDLMAGAERPVGARLAVSGAVGGVVRRGPDDVQPFKEGATQLSPAAEAALAVRLAAARPLFASVIVQGYRAEGSATGTAGMVPRLLIVLRHGR